MLIVSRIFANLRCLGFAIAKQKLAHFRNHELIMNHHIDVRLKKRPPQLHGNVWTGVRGKISFRYIFTGQ